MIRARNIVLQQRDYSCGAAALATLLRYYWGEPIEEIDVIKEIEAMLTPEELRDRVQNGSLDHRLATDGGQARLSIGHRHDDGRKLKESKVPVIVALDQDKYNHFVVIRAFYGGYAYLADPIRGIRANYGKRIYEPVDQEHLARRHSQRANAIDGFATRHLPGRDRSDLFESSDDSHPRR